MADDSALQDAGNAQGQAPEGTHLIPGPTQPGVANTPMQDISDALHQGQTPSPEQAQAIAPFVKMAMGQPGTPPPPAEMLTPLQEFSEDEKRKLAEHASRHLRRMHTFRRVYDPRRLSFFRQYLAQQDKRKFPDNLTDRSNTYLPYAYSNVETIVSHASDAFFSFDPWLECRGRGAMDEPAAEAMQLVLLQKLQQANLISVFEDFVRNVAIYGHSGLKVDWDWDYDTITTAQAQPLLGPTGQPVISPVTGQPMILGYKPVTVKVPRNRPKFTAIDVFDLLVDPDGVYVAHMIEKSLGQLKRELEMNPNLYYADGIAKIAARIGNIEDADEVVIRMAEFWDEIEGTVTLITFGEDYDSIRWKDARYSFRIGAGYSYYSRSRKVYGGPPILLYHDLNPFMHKKLPILHTSYNKLPNTVYGLGAIEVISDLNEALNRFVNMITDNWNLGINHRYAYDQQAEIDHTALNEMNVPGGKVAVVGDPSKAIFPLPSFTPTQGDYAILELYKGMIEMTGGISDFYSKGIGAPTGNRTATGIQSIMQESNFRFKMFIRNLEIDILQPLLRMCATMIQQYVTDDQEVALTDVAPGIPKYYKVKPESLIGSFEFDLVAANYVQNKMLRQRNILAFINLASKSPYLRERETLLEVGKIFEIRGMTRLLKTDQEVQQQQMAAQQAEMQHEIFEAKLNAMTQQAHTVVKEKYKAQTAGAKNAGGRPRTVQLEGKIPGAGATSMAREQGQNMGPNAMGIEGLGEMGGRGGTS